MKKKILFFIMILAAIFAAFALTACGKDDSETASETTEDSEGFENIVFEAPYVSDFTCVYYDSDGEMIKDKSTVFSPDDEIRVKTNFTLLPDAYAGGKNKFTVKFILSADFEGKIVSANSSTTSDKDLTATFTTYDKDSKNCEVEVQINVNYSAGSFKIAYAYDDEEYTEACELPLNNNKTLLYAYDEATDGYIVSRDLNNGGWIKSVTEAHIPDSYDGKPVTAIGEEVFYGCNYLTSVTLPDGITNIGENAFSFCEQLASITIPSSVKEIGPNAFRDCNGLTSVNITDIAAWCNINFASSGANPMNKTAGLYLKGEIVTDIPYGLTNIGNYAFSECNLTSITIPDSVTSVGEYAFSFCSGLTSLTIPAGLTSIGKCAFAYCDSLTSVTLPDGLTEITEGLFSGCGALTSIKIPDSVTTIGRSAFLACALKNIKIPRNVTSIGDYAFGYCGLQSITLPGGITNIGKYTFGHCASLRNITFGGTSDEWRAISSEAGYCDGVFGWITVQCSDEKIKFDFYKG